MTSLWPRIEPLLAQVTKPARYIGGELGACRPVEEVGGRHDELISQNGLYAELYRTQFERQQNDDDGGNQRRPL